MLRPVDLAAVVTGDRFHGTDYGYLDSNDPSQLHAGVAWWVGACLVLTTACRGVVLVHDGTELGREYAQALGSGAINCRHHAATVSVLGAGDDELLTYGIRALQVPGAIVTTDGCRVTLRLFTATGVPLTVGSGLERITDLIARDRVPIPVNDDSRGRVIDRSDLARHHATASEE